MPKNWSVNSDHVSKQVICACTKATEEYGFDLKIFPSKFFSLDQSFISIAQVVLEFMFLKVLEQLIFKARLNGGIFVTQSNIYDGASCENFRNKAFSRYLFSQNVPP